MRKIIEALEKSRAFDRRRRDLLESGAVRIESDDSNISDTEKRALKELVRKISEEHSNP
jgi:hypothetical protein